MKTIRKMNTQYLCLVIFAICAVISASANSTTKEFLDLNDDNDSVFLWQSLFTKINTLISETSKLSENHNENLNEIKESLFKLNKRQNEQEITLNNFMENTEKFLTDLKKGQRYTQFESKLKIFSFSSQNEQERVLKNFIENTQKPINDLKKGLDDEKNLLKQNLNHNHEWTTILRRLDGSINFYRNWTEYQKGFGNPDGEFFIGLDRLHAMTVQRGPQELMIILKDFENQTRIATYDLFQIGNETEKYSLKELGKHRGDADDSLIYHKGMKFSTLDQENDLSSASNCAELWKGAWWFNSCYESHLFGPYKSEAESKTKGVSWKSWKGHEYSLKFAEMKIRPNSY